MAWPQGTQCSRIICKSNLPQPIALSAPGIYQRHRDPLQAWEKSSCTQPRTGPNLLSRSPQRISPFGILPSERQSELILLKYSLNQKASFSILKAINPFSSLCGAQCYLALHKGALAPPGRRQRPGMQKK